MGSLILIIIMIYWLATDTTTALWVIGGVIVLAIIGSLLDGINGNKKNSTSGISGKPRIRIDHPHLIESSDYECTICGRRFGRNQMSCPYCGVRFTGTKEDFEEFDEEEDEWAAWDEEEGL